MIDCNKIQANNIACNEISLTSQSPRNGSQKGDLTSQWKKGKLPEGDYFISNGDEIYSDYYDSAEGFLKTFDYGVRRVIAEVPDYVEWQNMVNCACEEHEANKRLIEQNDKLKELLKECKEIFDECFSPSAKHGELYKKIDEVLKW